MGVKNEGRVVAGVLVLLACLQTADLLKSMPKDAAAPHQAEVEPQQAEIALEQTEVTPQDRLRPPGDFRELVYERLAHLQAASEESSCRSAHELGNLFHSLDDAERQAIEDEMIAQMVGLLDRDTVDGGDKCVSYVIGGIFMTIGPRAEAAVDSLERALKAAELARDARVPSEAECAGFRSGSDRMLDDLLRQALVEIDGRPRADWFTLTCPKDDDQPG